MDPYCQGKLCRNTYWYCLFFPDSFLFHLNVNVISGKFNFLFFTLKWIFSFLFTEDRAFLSFCLVYEFIWWDHYCNKGGGKLHPWGYLPHQLCLCAGHGSDPTFMEQHPDEASPALSLVVHLTRVMLFRCYFGNAISLKCEVTVVTDGKRDRALEVCFPAGGSAVVLSHGCSSSLVPSGVTRLWHRWQEAILRVIFLTRDCICRQLENRFRYRHCCVL